jgi:hypothetical protein
MIMVNLTVPFEDKRTENYAQLGKPVNPKTFTAELRASSTWATAWRLG